MSLLCIPIKRNKNHTLMEFYHKDIDTVKYVLATSNRPTQLEKKFLFCLVQKICFVKEKNVKK